jgi:acetyl-CoA acetyltransferase
MERNPQVDWAALDDVLLGCANQAGEDNRNVARMAVLLSGLPQDVPATTINRLCGSGMNAIGIAAQAIRSGDADCIIAGGAESMTRAPYVLGKAGTAFGRDQKIEDTTMGWRFINPALKATYGVDTMPQTAENVAQQWGVSREAQDALLWPASKRLQPRRPMAASPPKSCRWLCRRKRATPSSSPPTNTPAPQRWRRWPRSSLWCRPMARSQRAMPAG